MTYGRAKYAARSCLLDSGLTMMRLFASPTLATLRASRLVSLLSRGNPDRLSPAQPGGTNVANILLQ